MANIRFIYFDLGNVLLKFSIRNLLHQLSKLTGADDATLRMALFNDKRYTALESGQISGMEYYEGVCAELKQEIPLEEFVAATDNIFWVNDSILPVVRAVAKALFPRGILSNTGPSHWEYVHNLFPCIWELFPEHQIASFAVKNMKPYEPIFQIAFDEARKEIPDLRPEEVLFIDDLPENVEGGRKFGFQGLVYIDTPALVEEFKRLRLPTPEVG